MKIRRKHPVRVNHLGSDPIPQLVRRLALPAMLAQFVNVLYSIIDRMYIGNIANVGDIALAGVGICGPIVTMISAFAAWIGNGGAPLLSIKSGEQNKEGASAILANCFVLLIGMGSLPDHRRVPVQGRPAGMVRRDGSAFFPTQKPTCAFT